MKSIFRIELVILYFYSLIILSYISWLYVSNFFFNTDTLNTIRWGVFVFSIVLLVLILIYSLYFIKSISIEDESIVVRRLLKKTVYRNESIDGYRWTFIKISKISCKSIRIKTNKKIIKLSDFEYSNFSNLEKIIVSRYDLKISDKWKTPNKIEQEFELNKSEKFDIEQKKEIIFESGLNAVGSLVLIIFSIYDFNFNYHTFFLFYIFFIILFFIFSVRRFFMQLT